jgi:hypothetical protein
MDQSQREINDAQWHNPENWAGVDPFKAYFSKRDSRIWVPQYWNSKLSLTTLNLGHRFGFPILTLMWTLIASVLISAALANHR